MTMNRYVDGPVHIHVTAPIALILIEVLRQAMTYASAVEISLYEYLITEVNAALDHQSFLYSQDNKDLSFAGEDTEIVGSGDTCNIADITWEAGSGSIILRPPKPDAPPYALVYWRRKTREWIVNPGSKEPEYKNWKAIAMLADGMKVPDVVKETGLTQQKVVSLCGTQRKWIDELKALDPGQPRYNYMRRVYKMPAHISYEEALK